MPRLQADEIKQTDIEEYLDNYSDFSFELKVLESLNNQDFQCLHSGTYMDPITGKSREFDIRAVLAGQSMRVHLSVECKNIRRNFPLILHCTKRRTSESFHELVQVVGSQPSEMPTASVESSRVTRRCLSDSLYPVGEYVAKSADQVGRHVSGEIVATDGGVFDKISQAINSAQELISQAFEVGGPAHTLICPVLVVPDDTLWQVKYDDNGSRLEPAQQIEQASYFIGKEWTFDRLVDLITYTLSHLEIVTFSGITKLIERLTDDNMWCFPST
jgi:hypothetical protein